MKKTRSSRYSDEIKSQAKTLYLASLTPLEIKTKLDINSVRTVYNWVNDGGWNALLTVHGAEQQLEARLQQLTGREKKTKLELDEIDRLVTNIVKMRTANAKLRDQDVSVRAREQAIKEGNDTPAAGDGNSRSTKKPRKRKNDLPDVDDPRWQQWIDGLWGYQKIHFDAKELRERWTLKGRQVGFTYEASGEALYIARKTGKNQTFLSASKAQAHVFKSYMQRIAAELFDVELKGDVIKLSNGAELRFLGTNRNTAHSYSSDVYIDEAFWIHKFDAIYEVASAMATQSHYRVTVFSTPSTKQHKAYSVWSGSWWKGRDPKRVDIPFPELNTLRKHPQVCADKRWRFVVTIHDAIAGGNTLIDINDLRERYSPEAFDYLFNCEFMDEADSVFKLKDLEGCPVFVGEWKDFDPYGARPLDNKEVVLGYDPARVGDQAKCDVLAKPDKQYPYFRVIEQHEWSGFNWQWQADQIEALTERYNVVHIGIDCSGIGSGVAELVQAFFPRAMLIAYGQQSKINLVLKALDVVYQHRLRWRDDFKTIPVSFMSIKRKTTGNSTMTFAAERTDEAGHADDFFAICHALACEDLNVNRKRESTIVMGL